MRKAFTVELNEKLADEFTDFVDKRGLKKTRALEGAVRGFMAYPPDVQTRLMDNSLSDAYTILVDGLVDAEIAKHIDELGPAKDKFLALLKQATEKGGRKKKAL